MRYLLFCLVILFSAGQLSAQDRWLYWKYKDYSGGINFSVPRLAIGAGSLFLKERSERKLMRQVHKVRTLVFEDGNPLSGRDIRRFERKARRRHLEDLIMVRDGSTHVHIMAKERRQALRKVVVFVSSPEDGFVMVSIKGKIKFADMNRIIGKIAKDKDGSIQKSLPSVIKIPTDRA